MQYTKSKINNLCVRVRIVELYAKLWKIMRNIFEEYA